MKDNMFENAYFGKPYKTRDGSKALFIRYNKDDDDYELETEETCFYARKDGTDLFTKIGYESSLDIVSEYEEELDELARKNIPADYNDCTEHGFGTGDYEPAEDHSIERECFVEGFKSAEEIYKQAISKALRYMMTNEMYFGSRQNGNRVDGEYIDGFIKRLFKNVEEDINNEG